MRPVRYDRLRSINEKRYAHSTWRTVSKFMSAQTSRTSASIMIAAWVLAAVLIHFSAGTPPTSPVVFPDELCFLGWARFLIGGGFYEMGGAAYCHPTYPLLLAPLHAVTNNPTAAYELSVAFNALLAATCLPLARWIGLRHLGMSEPRAWCAGILSVAYPAVAGYSHYVWPETLLYLLCLVWLWAWCRAIDKPDLNRVTILITVVLTLYLAHPRMLALVVVHVVGIVWWTSASRRKTTGLLLLFACVSVLWLISQMKGMTLALAWSSGDTLGPVGRLTDALAGGAIPQLIARISGQWLFALFATLGLSWLPLVWTLLRAGPALFGHRTQTEGIDTFFLKVCAAPVMLASLSGVAAIFLVEGPRFDTYFYGRYVGPLVVTNMIVGLALMRTLQNRTAAILFSSIALVCVAMLSLFGPDDAAADYSRIHVVGLSFLIDSLYEVVGTEKFPALLGSATAFIVAAAILCSGKRWSWSVALLLLGSGLMHLTGESRRQISKTNSFPPEARAALSSAKCAVQWVPVGTTRSQKHQAYRLQYEFPNCTLSFINIVGCRPATSFLVVPRALRCKNAPIADPILIPPDLLLYSPPVAKY